MTQNLRIDGGLKSHPYFRMFFIYLTTHIHLCCENNSIFDPEKHNLVDIFIDIKLGKIIES